MKFRIKNEKCGSRITDNNKSDRFCVEMICDKIIEFVQNEEYENWYYNITAIKGHRYNYHISWLEPVVISSKFFNLRDR